MKYFFIRKYQQIRNLFKWIPIIWKQYDFDYCYSIEVFKFQLKKQAEFLESDKARTLSSKDNAKRIRMVIRLMDKVYNEDYAHEYLDKMKAIYGEDILDFEFIKTGNGYSTLNFKYELTKTEEEINEINEVKDRLFNESNNKQKRAHKLLWKLIEHNIQHWWD